MSSAETRPSPILTVLAFLAVAGSFGAGLAVSLHRVEPPELVPQPEPAPAEKPMQVYYPFPEEIYITRPDQTMVIASVSFFLEGAPEALLHLQEVAKTRQSELQAALLAAAQAQAERSPDLAAYRSDLPTALLAEVNRLLGDEAMPAPVLEVLLTQFVAR